MVRRHGVEQNVVEVLGALACRFQGTLRCRQSQVRNTGRRRAEMALGDTGALADPLVVRIENPREVVVGVGTARNVAAGAEDADAGHWVKQRAALENSASYSTSWGSSRPRLVIF